MRAAAIVVLARVLAGDVRLRRGGRDRRVDDCRAALASEAEAGGYLLHARKTRDRARTRPRCYSAALTRRGLALGCPRAARAAAAACRAPRGRFRFFRMSSRTSYPDDSTGDGPRLGRGARAALEDAVACCAALGAHAKEATRRTSSWRGRLRSRQLSGSESVAAATWRGGEAVAGPLRIGGGGARGGSWAGSTLVSGGWVRWGTGRRVSAAPTASRGFRCAAHGANLGRCERRLKSENRQPSFAKFAQSSRLASERQRPDAVV